MGKRIVVSAALPYINNVPHMGHIVGSHLPADIFHRCAKAKGFDSIFIGGSDEHGTPSAVAAKQLGIHPKRLVDSLHEIHKGIYEKMGISYSAYSRTSDPDHALLATGFFETIQNRGLISKADMRMYYCSKDGMFLPDRFVVGTCPECGFEDANADQCERCGSVLTPETLKDPRCRSCDEKPIMRSSEHLFLDLGAVAEDLSRWIDSKKGLWRDHVVSEARRWLAKGLRPRSITRDLSWGIPVPGLQGKAFYVWFEAPIAYISFLEKVGKGLGDEIWKDPDTRIAHFLGKDNIPFHTVFWPSMLLAHGGLRMPDDVAGYNYLLYEGRKFSKSKGVGVFCANLLDTDIQIDALRGYLTSILPETRDSSFRWEDHAAFVNSELIGKFGNFFNRTLSMIRRYQDGVSSLPPGRNDGKAKEDLALARSRYPKEIGEAIMRTDIRKALGLLMEFASEGNVFLERSAPWKAVKEDPQEAATILHMALETSRSLAICAAPFFPQSMDTLWREQLLLEGSPRETGIWESAGYPDRIPSGHIIGQASPLFRRIDEPGLKELQSRMSRAHSLKEMIESAGRE